jgi:hypothetical protein
MLQIGAHEDGLGQRITIMDEDGDALFEVATPVILEKLSGTGTVERTSVGYTSVSRDGNKLEGSVEVRGPLSRYVVLDSWRVEEDGVHLHRRVSGGAQGEEAIRLVLEAVVAPDRLSFREARLFAPPALYDLNDIDQDGVEDYLDTRTLVYRDDRLTGLAVFAYSPAERRGYSLTREDVPVFDDVPERQRGQRDIVQRTDIGSLGVSPTENDGTLLVAAYPFVERDRSNALTSEERAPWGAFWPASGDGSVEFEVDYRVAVHLGATPIDSLWALWEDRHAVLAPEPVELTDSLEEITRLRLEALIPYYARSSDPDSAAAGFVTNCHPQDGKQLENIIQYGFTGQNVLNAHHVLNHAGELTDPEARNKALSVVQFFVSQAAASPHALTHTLFDLETGRTSNWWSGLVLPLAYASEGDDLEALMGPVYDHMRYAIDPLRELDGTYLRCMAEEHGALLRAYEAEMNRGVEHRDWLELGYRFGEFLLTSQDADGSWRRAYDFDGRPIIEPRAWFGTVDLNQKSSTATAVPFLVALHRVSGEHRWLDAAMRAERFAAEHFVAAIKHNGGIHDSIYARAQLVDSESILFCMRASLQVWELTNDDAVLQTAKDAAHLLATWIYLWDVPLPPASTLAKFGFRSTGWSACDTAGAGYIHPYEIHAVPDMLQIAAAVDDDVLSRIAEITLVGSSETVATSTKDWGYARLGLQEEGLLVSWWLIDDPMFVGTSFGGRGKGEGNKTCLPWISAVSIDAYDEMMRRFGTVVPNSSNFRQVPALGTSRD